MLAIRRMHATPFEIEMQPNHRLRQAFRAHWANIPECLKHDLTWADATERGLQKEDHSPDAANWFSAIASRRAAPINSAAMRLNITEMFQRKTRKASSHASGIDGKNAPTRERGRADPDRCNREPGPKLPGRRSRSETKLAGAGGVPFDSVGGTRCEVYSLLSKVSQWVTCR
jgi:hypothetical protein